MSTGWWEASLVSAQRSCLIILNYDWWLTSLVKEGKQTEHRQATDTNGTQLTKARTAAETHGLFRAELPRLSLHPGRWCVTEKIPHDEAGERALSSTHLSLAQVFTFCDFKKKEINRRLYIYFQETNIISVQETFLRDNSTNIFC